jgi:hypothetical protein
MKLNKKLVKSYAYVFNTPEGREILEDLEELSGFLSMTDSTDPVELGHLAGKRDFYLYIKLMLDEAKENK